MGATHVDAMPIAMPIVALARPRPARAPPSRRAKTRARVVLARAASLSLCARGANAPHPDKTAKGGEDAWFARVDATRGGGVLGVADGVGGFNDQGVDPGLYARVLAHEALREIAREGETAAKDAMAAAQRETKIPGAATMCVVRLDGDVLRGFRVVRDGRVVGASTAQQHYFNCPYQLAYAELAKDGDSASDAEEFEVKVRVGDIVVLGSDGLFDNVFDEEIAAVATEAYGRASDEASGAGAAAQALVKVARGHAEDKKYDSPYAREMAKSETDKGGAPKAVGLFGGLNKMLGGGSLGGKMDDITVIVAGVVQTSESREVLASASASCDANTEALAKARELASIEEVKVQRTVALRKEMDAAFKESVAASEKKSKAIANAKPEFTRAQVDSMDAPTIRKLLQERGLPSSGKLERLRDRLAEVKAL
ncbi:phosphatase 2C-like domain-containing protein [Ostreococcus tauri]|uniref:Protein phosphatase n=1 Tax=Ostreococcus tauri TaxID=70448 RepID=A0A1Y5I7N7_OSTTA|nr:phosphatase 2C-like domain-containing protein [Ostreococcus tauri]